MYHGYYIDIVHNKFQIYFYFRCTIKTICQI